MSTKPVRRLTDAQRARLLHSASHTAPTPFLGRLEFLCNRCNRPIYSDSIATLCGPCGAASEAMYPGNPIVQGEVSGA